MEIFLNILLVIACLLALEIFLPIFVYFVGFLVVYLLIFAFCLVAILTSLIFAPFCWLFSKIKIPPFFNVLCDDFLERSKFDGRINID